MHCDCLWCLSWLMLAFHLCCSEALAVLRQALHETLLLEAVVEISFSYVHLNTPQLPYSSAASCYFWKFLAARLCWWLEECAQRAKNLCVFFFTQCSCERNWILYVPGMNYALRKTVSAGEEDSVNTVCPSHVHYTVQWTLLSSDEQISHCQP